MKTQVFFKGPLAFSSGPLSQAHGGGVQDPLGLGNTPSTILSVAWLQGNSGALSVPVTKAAFSFLQIHPHGPWEVKGEEGSGPALKKESDVETWGASLLTPASAGPNHPRITSPMLH